MWCKCFHVNMSDFASCQSLAKCHGGYMTSHACQACACQYKEEADRTASRDNVGRRHFLSVQSDTSGKG